MTISSRLARVEGPNLVLRLIEPDDATYLYGLRSNPKYNRYLSPVEGTIEDQKRWIERYKEREAQGRELYYVNERHDGQSCGVVRLYDIEDDQFTWGSWILDENKPRKAALESAVLSFGVGFEALGLERALVDVRKDNERALSIYLKFGMTEVRRTDQDIFFRYDRDAFLERKNAHLAIIHEAAIQ